MPATAKQESTFELQDIINHFEQEYYLSIESSCDRGDEQLKTLQPDTLTLLQNQYKEHATILLEDLRKFLAQRRISTNPYVHELIAKKAEGHDCRTCSGTCSVRHTAQLIEVIEAQVKIKQSLGLLQSLSELLKKDQKSNLTFSPFEREVILLDVVLNELFYQEEFVLLPKLRAEQNKIYARK